MKLSCLLLPNATKRNSQFQITLFCSQVHFLSSVFLELPVTVAQRADVPGLEPPGDAVEVECVVTHAPGHCALLTGGTGLVGLTLDAQVHDVVPADGAVVHHNVPGPQGTSIPFLHLEPALSAPAGLSLGTGFALGRSSWWHLSVTILLHLLL